VLGKEHFETLLSMGDLARTYRKQGKLIEADELDVGVMETSWHMCNTEDPSVLTSVTNLALV